MQFQSGEGLMARGRLEGRRASGKRRFSNFLSNYEHGFTAYRPHENNRVQARLRMRSLSRRRRKPSLGCWMLDVGCWMLDVGCWMLDVDGRAYFRRTTTFQAHLS
jgi:hypothetical protein